MFPGACLKSELLSSRAVACVGTQPQSCREGLEIEGVLTPEGVLVRLGDYLLEQALVILARRQAAPPGQTG